MSKHLIDLVVLTSRLLQPKYATIEKTGKLTVRSQPKGPRRSAKIILSLTIIPKISSCKSSIRAPNDLVILSNRPQTWCHEAMVLHEARFKRPLLRLPPMPHKTTYSKPSGG